MGRHSNHRRGWRLTSPVPLLSVLLVVMLAAWGSFTYLREQLADNGCAVPTTVRIAAAPGIAPAIADVANNRTQQDQPDCYRVDVVAKNSTDVAETVAAVEDSNFDVWIPESSMWLRMAANKGAWRIPKTGTSVARTPVVMAMTAEAADKLGGAKSTPTMAEVLGADGDAVTVGMPDPSRNPVGLAVLFGVKALTQDASNADSAFTRTARDLGAHVVSKSSILFDRLPAPSGQDGAADQDGSSGQDGPPDNGNGTSQLIEAFPATESSVLRYNAQQGTQDLVISYPDVAVPSFDYPYVVLPGTPETVRTGAERFLAQLHSRSASEIFTDAGFRGPKGLFPAQSWPKAPRKPASEPMKPDGKTLAIHDVLHSWAGANRSATIHVLLDISGSMAQRVANTGKTRMELTVQAALKGLGLFKSSTELELWVFSTDLANGKDYRTMLPMRTVAGHIRAGAIKKLKSLEPKPYGGTGLYDSVLAAYKDATRNYESGRLNMVIALTDGQNTDSNSIGLDKLLDKLRKLHNQRQPIPFVGIGIGPGVDPSELRAIAKATGGHVFTTADPTKISQVFYKALSKIICKSPGCKA